jgi:hypothetical protein
MKQTLTPALARVFKRLNFPFDVMLMCVRWYVAYGLSASAESLVMRVERRGSVIRLTKVINPLVGEE